MSINSRSDQLIECVVKKVAVESSLHAAQMLLLDVVAILDDDNDSDSRSKALALERFETDARHYLNTSAWVLPPDDKLLARLDLSDGLSPSEAAGVVPPAGEAGGVTPSGDGEAY